MSQPSSIDSFLLNRGRSYIWTISLRMVSTNSMTKLRAATRDVWEQANTEIDTTAATTAKV
ncbi:hypothetical protein KOR34_18370 [Posidoniimonas corsicana]|uniref:Uncharacterized protein n=1 Tax=Posidoniimonas corsicana TaxID=1938618 RepID=A0A5C5VGW4_9BACT|nr:hypothetical protein KOR34_18370 [Posidoniimonas corsicana]